MSEACLIIGAGGHARAVVSTLLRKQEFVVVAVLDHAEEKSNEFILDVPVVGAKNLIAALEKQGIKNVFLAVGDNQKRRELFLMLAEEGYQLPNHIAKTATVCQEVKMGRGNIIFENTFIGPLCEIADNNILNNGCVFEHESRLGSHSHIGPNSSVGGRVTLGDLVFLGLGSCVIPSLKIGDEITLGAGGVFTKNINESGSYVGAPARPLLDNA